MLRHVHTDRSIDFEAFDLPISQAVVHGDTVYVAGMTGIDPGTGELVEGGAGPETRQSLKNIEAILDAADTTLDNLVKVTIFAKDMDEFGAINEAYGDVVPAPYPARSTFEASDLAMDFAVEIEAIAAKVDRSIAG